MANKNGKNRAVETRLSKDPIFAKDIIARIKMVGTAKVLKYSNIQDIATIRRYMKGGKAFESTEEDILKSLFTAERVLLHKVKKIKSNLEK